MLRKILKISLLIICVGFVSAFIRGYKSFGETNKLKEQGITIDKSNYSRLYYGSKLFKQCFKITKEELLEKYPYNNYNSICKQDKKVTR